MPMDDTASAEAGANSSAEAEGVADAPTALEAARIEILTKFGALDTEDQIEVIRMMIDDSYLIDVQVAEWAKSNGDPVPDDINQRIQNSERVIIEAALIALNGATEKQENAIRKMVANAKIPLVQPEALQAARDAQMDPVQDTVETVSNTGSFVLPAEAQRDNDISDINSLIDDLDNVDETSRDTFIRVISEKISEASDGVTNPAQSEALNAAQKRMGETVNMAANTGGFTLPAEAQRDSDIADINSLIDNLDNVSEVSRDVLTREINKKILEASDGVTNPAQIAALDVAREKMGWTKEEVAIDNTAPLTFKTAPDMVRDFYKAQSVAVPPEVEELLEKAEKATKSDGKRASYAFYDVAIGSKGSLANVFGSVAEKPVSELINLVATEGKGHARFLAEDAQQKSKYVKVRYNINLGLPKR